MPADRKFRLQLLESRKAQPSERKRDRITRAKPETTPRAVLRSLKDTPGADDILKRVPDFGELALWQQIAYFSVCRKSGSARWLDIWDADHFDGFTDMQRCINDCRAWFSADGFATWGSAETKTGRVNCYFTAPTAANYVCNARLQSYPATARAVVECLIDNSSFGPLSWTGTIDQPHPCTLSAGGHHFRIRQVSGSFFFLSLTVYRV
jgi:hypothetical protein